MATEEQNQEAAQEQEPVFTFTPIEPNNTQNDATAFDTVELKEEEAPANDQKGDEENQEQKAEDEVNEEEEEEEAVDEVYDLDEDLAYKFLKQKKGLEFDSFDEFLKSKEVKKLDPEIEKFLDYKEKTGRGYSDFLETQKDWSAESPESLVKASLKLQNPSLSNDEIEFIFDRDYAFDTDIDDDRDIKSKTINLKVEAKKALDLLNKQKEDYMVVRGSDDSDIPEIYKEAKTLIDDLFDEQTENETIAKGRRDAFISKTQEALSDKFEGFKFNVEGQEFTVKPEDIKATRTAQMDIANLQKNFFDKDQNLTDPVGYHRALFAAMDPDKLAKHFFNLGKTSYAEQLDRDSKNIDVKGEKHLPNPSLETFTFKKA